MTPPLGAKVALAATLGLASCTSAAVDRSRPTAYAPTIEPAGFSTAITNPFLPLVPGGRWVYEGKTAEGTERITVVVTGRTKVVMGVRCVVVRDTVSLDGSVIEDTFDWYAQDRAGNVWYFGEDTKEYEDGRVVSTKGSWQAGVAGAQPGIAMKAEPARGEGYRQEYFAGEAEDMAEVLRLDGEATVPFGTYTGLLVTKDFTPLEPGLEEHKYYARGVGMVLEVGVLGSTARLELVTFTAPTA